MLAHPRTSVALVLTVLTLAMEARSQEPAASAAPAAAAPVMPTTAVSAGSPAAGLPSAPSTSASTPVVTATATGAPAAPPFVGTPSAGPYNCAPLPPPGYGYFLMPAEPGPHPFALPGVGVAPSGVPGVTGAPLLDYTEGQPIPPGYHLEQRARRGLVLAGSLTAGVPFLASFLTCLSIGLSGSRRDGEATVALMAPLVGPFITLKTAEAEGAGILWLMLDGVAQLAGTGMLLGGLVAKQDKLVRDHQDASLVPDVRVGPAGRGDGDVDLLKREPKP